jgi:hypothetical protein
MKIFSAALAFCVMQGTAAFVIQAPKTNTQRIVKPRVALRSSPSEEQPAVETTTRSGPQAPPSGALSSDGTATQAKKAPISPAKIWDTSQLVKVEGNSLRTWDVHHSVDAMQVLMKTEGRPLNALVELWHGPDYTPSKLAVYIEDADLRPFNAVVKTPYGGNTVAIYNTAAQEYPLTACVYGNVDDDGSSALMEAPTSLSETSVARTVQGGGMVTTYPFDASVQSVQVLLKTDGRNLNARIELLQGPNNIKQVMEFYSSDGYKRPFFAIIETPNVGNVVRIVNQATVEYPFTAYVEPYLVEAGRFQGRPMP